MIKKLTKDVRPVNFKISRRVWARFRALSESIGITSSAYLRSLIYTELRKKDETGPKPGPIGE